MRKLFMTKKFDALYEHILNDHQLDEGLRDFWNKLLGKQYDLNIAYDLIYFTGNKTDNKIDQIDEIKRIFKNLNNTLYANTIVDNFNTGYNTTEITVGDIKRVISTLLKNNRKFFSTHLIVKNGLSNEYVQKQLQRYLS